MQFLLSPGVCRVSSRRPIGSRQNGVDAPKEFNSGRQTLPSTIHANFFIVIVLCPSALVSLRRADLHIGPVKLNQLLLGPLSEDPGPPAGATVAPCKPSVHIRTCGGL